MRIRSVTITVILLTLVSHPEGCRKHDEPSPPVSDIDGNSYKTVKIGSQVWMAENLKTTKLSDGTVIDLNVPAADWENLTAMSYCWYGNDELSFKETYGALYNGFAVATGKLCPDGWHIPEKTEFADLLTFLGDSARAGGKLKEAGLTHWQLPNKGADNSTGFSALPAGVRYSEGTFASQLSFTGFWSSTLSGADDEWFADLYYADASLKLDHRNKRYGLSVRCVKD